MRRALTASILLSLSGVVALSAPPDTRLAEAVKKGDKASAAALLQQKVDVNAPEVDGTTALHWAVRADDLALVDKLIAGGAKVRVQTDMVSRRFTWHRLMAVLPCWKNY